MLKKPQAISLFHNDQLIPVLTKLIQAKQQVLIITSMPSISRVIQDHILDLRLYEITGANHNQYAFVIEKLQNQDLDVLVLGYEQLINPPKLNDVIATYQNVDYVLIMNINQSIPSNFDYRVEFENLPLIFTAFNKAQFMFFTYALSESELKELETRYHLEHHFQTNNQDAIYYELDVYERFNPLLEILKGQATIIIVHDYDEATMLANQINHFQPCGVVHRRVPEIQKVIYQDQWQAGELANLVITSDTILPFKHPEITQIIWAAPPLSFSQMEFFHHFLQSKQTYLLFNKNHYDQNHIFTHQFVLDQSLNDLLNLLKDYPDGLTMREIERHLDGNSYTLEKAIKGLLVFGALKRKKAGYILDLPFYVTTSMAQAYAQAKIDDYHYFIDQLIPDYCPYTIDDVADTLNHLPLVVPPKVLFPTGFFNRSLIDINLQSQPGYVFYKTYDHLNQRINAINKLLASLEIDLNDTSVTYLSKDDDVKSLAQHFSQGLGLPLSTCFGPFDSSLIKRAANPYHKMKAILNQFNLLSTKLLKATTIVFADHGDHYWQMGVIAKSLLENKMTKQVIVIFNQP